jgi:Uma2 family endonuclease
MVDLPARRFSRSEYHRLAEIGVLKPDERVELLDGIIYNMAPMGPFHGGVSNTFVGYLWQIAQGRWVVWTQSPIALSKGSEPEPDIALLAPADHCYMQRHPTPDDVFLIIEISDSSLELDRSIKLPLYARSAVPEVWILNLREKVVEVYCEPSAGIYSRSENYRAGQNVTLSAFPDVKIPVTDIFRHLSNRSA